MNELALKQPIDSGLRELALFAGAGGGILGGKLLGWRTVCAVEWDAYAASVLIARQNDGILPPFPIWDDVQTFDGKPWRGCVDVVSGGFPCQDISCAGKGAGIEGERSGMWKHMARIIGEVLPRFVFVENSPMLVGRGLAVVLGDLAEMGYDARWGIVGAHHAAAPHKRDRIWIVAHADSGRRSQRNKEERGISEPYKGSNVLSDPHSNGRNQRWNCFKKTRSNGTFRNAWWATEPDVSRVANGMAARVDRLRCIGNGQVPLCAALAWKILFGVA
jgi:DNA (cytosine-5)-methyltransferase 1